MKDEIKEILYCDIYNDLDDEKYNKLLDYITNLQEENVVLKSQLLQDNKSYHDMQDRIKKAIEYINLVATDHDIMNNDEIIYTQMQYEQIENLLEILKGE